MNIEHGLFDHMVLQRNRRSVSEVEFGGACASRGAVTATVRKNGRVVKGFADVKVGNAARGRFRGRLTGIPCGGPYEVELRVAGRKELVVKDVLVGDVWLLGGQSNMQGIGLMKDAVKPHQRVCAFYMNDCWAPAKDPIHNIWDCVDQVHIDLSGGRPVRDPVVGICPGPAFGQEMFRLTGGVPQGLIACGHGGTSMTQWDPKLKKLGGKSLYGAMIRRLRKNGGRIAGLVWYQGESDANADAAPLYTGRMRHFINSLRRDCRDAKLPVAVVQISRVADGDQTVWRHWNSIQDQQRRWATTIPNCAVVPAVDLTLDDGIHISGRGQNRLGARLAYAMHVLRNGKKAGKPPIEVSRISIESPRSTNVIVEFLNVVGKLRADGRPSGFAVVGAGNAAVFDTAVDGTRAVVKTTLSPGMAGNAKLYYGYGTNPYCNVTDEADRSLPAFGPMPLGRPRAISALVTTLRVSAFQPSAGKLDRLECHTNIDALQMAARTFADFCNMRPEIMQRQSEDNVIFYACKLECQEPMKLALLMGYDGPLKAWVDGREVFHDPDGINPALLDDAKAPFAASQGTHEVLIALGTNHGGAWGIWLRIERLDVPSRLIAKGPEHYVLPRILG